MNMPLETHNPINVTVQAFIDEAILPLVALQPSEFWQNANRLVGQFSPANRAEPVNSLELANSLEPVNSLELANSLEPINSLELTNSNDDFTINTTNVDDEIAILAGPQLVAPIKSADFSLNAANARWGSLYKALHGADAMSYGKDFLDETFPLTTGSHRDVASYMVYYQHLLAVFSDGSSCGLKNPCQFVALSGHKSEPTSIVLKNNGLHIEIAINRQGTNGSRDLAGIDDIQIEAALTTVMDFEPTTNAESKIEAYRNWLGLVQGDLEVFSDNNGQRLTRHVNHDKIFTQKHGDDLQLHGRSLMLARNNSADVMDIIMTALIGSLDLQSQNPRRNLTRNSRNGSIYIVKAKTHGPKEVQMSCELFDAVEKMLGLAPNTLKLCILDEARNTTANLKECIRIAKDRVVYIHTDGGMARALSPSAAVLAALRFYQDKRHDLQTAPLEAPVYMADVKIVSEAVRKTANSGFIVTANT